jgi:hypothetical protein
MQNNSSAQVVIGAHRPKSGKLDDLVEQTREHLYVLRAESLVTAMTFTVLGA